MFRNVHHARFVLEHLRRKRESQAPEACTDLCDWCGEEVAVSELRDVSKLFDALPGGEAMVGDVCAACVQREHEERELAANDGCYAGTEFVR